MQDRYAGDIGDFGKIALLRSLKAQGINIGVNWYKTESLSTEKNPDGSFKKSDGRYLITKKYMQCDTDLAGKLINIVNGENRSIDALEKANLIDGAIYYSEPITVRNRSEWHKTALERLQLADLVFVDPDNGMLVKSVGKGSLRSVKYAFYEEVRDYINQGQSVLIYNHRSRKPEEKYFQDICNALEYYTGVKTDNILKITFPRYSVRDYFAVPVSEEYLLRIRKSFTDMEHGAWGTFGFCYIPKY